MSRGFGRNVLILLNLLIEVKVLGVFGHQKGVKPD